MYQKGMLKYNEENGRYGITGKRERKPEKRREKKSQESCVRSEAIKKESRTDMK